MYVHTRIINEIGNKYGKWTVISSAESQKSGALWKCKCECGEEKIVKGYHLRGGESTGCHKCSCAEGHLNILNNKDVLDGLLLGDGCISSYSERLFPTLHVSQIHKGLVEYLKNHLCPEARISKQNTTNKPQYRFSVTNPSLVKIRERWYKNNQKIVPKDLIFSPLMVLNWFMGDGSTSWTTNKKQVILTLSTESFTEREVLFLKNGLSNAIGEEIKMSTNGESALNENHFRLTSGKSSVTNAFFDYIGECPVEDMKYRWKRGRALN